MGDKMKEKVCSNCGRHFIDKHHNNKSKKKFCSRECYYEFIRGNPIYLNSNSKWQVILEKLKEERRQPQHAYFNLK